MYQERGEVRERGRRHRGGEREGKEIEGGMGGIEYAGTDMCDHNVSVTYKLSHMDEPLL